MQRSQSRMWACRDPPRINTSAVLRTYGICHLPLGKRLFLDSAAAPPPSSSHLSLSDFPSLSLSLLLSGFKGLKCFSCLLCIKCPPPHLPPPATLNFAVLREKWLSGGEAADAVKPSQTEAGVITGRCSLLIPCEEVNGAGVAEKVLPAPTEQLILYNGPQFGCGYDTFWW